MLSNPDTLTLLAPAFAGGIAGRLCRLPGGALLFATVAVAITANYWDLSHQVPFEMVLVLQILMGCMLGQSINRRFWQDFLQIWRPTLLVVLAYTVLSVPFAAFLAWCCGFELLTAILAATPARMQDMIVLAGTMNSDAVTVMLMQLARQFAIIGITPFMMAGYARKGSAVDAAVAKSALKRTGGGSAIAACRAVAPDYAILLIPGCAGAFFGHLSEHVLGPLLGAFAGVAFSRVAWSRAGEVPFPKPFGLILQCLAGILLGARVTPEIGSLLLDRSVPLLSAVAYVLGAGIVIAWVLHRHYAWHKGLSWLAAAPGRASDMLAISQDIDLSGRERLALVSVHTVRQVYFTILISIVTVFF